jgi:hypothetical protein
LEQLLNYPHEVEWTPFQTHYFSENLVAPGIEPGTSGSVARDSDHKTTEAVKVGTNFADKRRSLSWGLQAMELFFYYKCKWRK